MKIGSVISVADHHAKVNGKSVIQPGLPGRWSVWSPAGEVASGYFVIPSDEAARGTGIKFAVVRAVQPKMEAKPTITLRRTEPADAMPKVRPTK